VLAIAMRVFFLNFLLYPWLYIVISELENGSVCTTAGGRFSSLRMVYKMPENGNGFPTHLTSKQSKDKITELRSPLRLSLHQLTGRSLSQSHQKVGNEEGGRSDAQPVRGSTAPVTSTQGSFLPCLCCSVRSSNLFNCRLYGRLPERKFPRVS